MGGRSWMDRIRNYSIFILCSVYCPRRLSGLLLEDIWFRLAGCHSSVQRFHARRLPLIAWPTYELQQHSQDGEPRNCGAGYAIGEELNPFG